MIFDDEEEDNKEEDEEPKNEDEEPFIVQIIS